MFKVHQFRSTSPGLLLLLLPLLLVIVLPLLLILGAVSTLGALLVGGRRMPVLRRGNLQDIFGARGGSPLRESYIHNQDSREQSAIQTEGDVIEVSDFKKIE